MRRLFSIALLALACGGCFNPDEPVCSYQCAAVEPRCPDDYECRADGYCHKKGTTAACSFPAIDMSVPSVPVDMTPTGTSD